MSRRVVVLVGAVVAVALLVAAGVLVSRAYFGRGVELASPAATPAEVTEQLRSEYRAAIDAWPYPLPAEDALPEHPPSSGAVAGFVSAFYRCAWEAAYLTGSGDSHERALDMLAAWEQLPPGVSFADNADGAYRTAVIGAARAGDDTAISDIFENGCSEYRDTRVAPPGGVTIDKPLPAPAPAAGELCADLPADVPCDPGFGPDRVIDTGPTEFARGETGLDSRGVPIVYLVAPGDSWFAVADRFQLGARLWPLNCYRFAGPELYVGDIVNLSAYRVATVGVNNGSSDGGPARDDCLRQTGLPPQV